MTSTNRGSFQVLFLCTGNSARAISGEYLLRARGKGRFERFSTGAQSAAASLLLP